MAQSALKIIETAGQTKIMQLVQSISEAISNGQYQVGNALPSVNQLSNETGFSRDTVFKAYNILKQRNLVESTPQKGYFVANETVKIFMLLDDFSAFKEQLYQAFRQNIPDSYSVDLLFHHYNIDVFNQLIENSLGRYSLYIIMNINHKTIEPVLDKIDPNKLLILDMGNPVSEKYNYLLQNFNKSVITCLKQGVEKLKKYNELILIYAEDNTPHPMETVEAVRSFCKKYNIKFSKKEKLEIHNIRKGQAYFVIRDSDLVSVIKACRNKNLQLGKDLGILSYNDTPMKEIVGGGISVISINFEMMGIKAADFVKNKQKLGEILPTFLILRDSL